MTGQLTGAPRATQSTVDLAALPRLMRLIHQVPAHLRRFTVPARVARSQHGLGPELADLLVAEGLPHVGRGEERLFDDYDLGNLALHLGRVTVRRMAMRSWATSLGRNGAHPSVDVRVGVVPRCPVPPHEGSCTFRLLRESGRREPVTAVPDGRSPVAHYDLRLRSEWPELPAPVRELADEQADLDFFLLPEAIRWDQDFMLRTRMADCGGAADRLVREGRRRGLKVRFAFGLLVAKPYSTPHCWAEFLVDGLWTPYDPLLLKAMRQWAGLDPLVWHQYRSTGAVLHRLCGHFTKVASHDGVWAPLSLPTDYQTGE